MVCLTAVLPGCATHERNYDDVLVVSNGTAQPARRYQRPEERNNNKVSVEKKDSSRLTVENYIEKGAVPQDCQTGNYEMDSRCLYDFSMTLDKLQKRCVRERLVNNEDCKKNPGILSGEYAILADKLQNLQDKKRAGIMMDR